MFCEKDVQKVILNTLEQLRNTIERSSRENYSKAELIELLSNVSDIMTNM